jgi:hypothetical protein
MFAQKQKPVDLATEGLRLVSIERNCRIRVLNDGLGGVFYGLNAYKLLERIEGFRADNS